MVTENNLICVHHGDAYHVDYVMRLYKSAKYFARRDFNFYVLTDNHDKFPQGMGWNFIKLPTWKIPRIKGWWYKMELFNPTNGFKGQNLYMDLDVVIVNEIDSFWDFKSDKFRMCHDFNKAFHKHITLSNSSIMAWHDSSMDWLYDKFAPYKEEIIRRYRGDQDFIQIQTPDKVWFPDDWAMSWKWEVERGGRVTANGKFKSNEPYVIQPDTKVIVFHGKPDPHEVPEIQHLWNK